MVEVVSSFDFNFNLRHYTADEPQTWFVPFSSFMVGRCTLKGLNFRVESALCQRLKPLFFDIY